MKAATPDMQALIYQTGSWFAADLVTVSLSDQTLRWTTFDQDLTIGGTTWTASNDLQKANLIAFSEDYTGWMQTAVSIASGSTAPNGKPTAQTIVCTSASSQHRVGRSAGLAGAATATISAYLKAAGETQAGLYIDNPWQGGAWDLSSGTFLGYLAGGTQAASASIAAVGSGWYRCSLTVFASGGTNLWSYVSRDGATASGFAGNGTSGVKLWGAQVVTGTSLTDYVPTTSASVTVPTSPSLVPSSNRSALGFEVTTLDLIVDGADVTLSGGQTLNQAATFGRFDGARVTVERALMAVPGDTAPGKFTVFDGQVAQAEPGSTELRLRVRSKADLFKTKFPRRMYQPSCPYVLGDSRCGVNLSTYTVPRWVDSTSSTTTSVRMGYLSAGNAYFNSGTLTITAGPMNGLTRTIVDDYDLGGQVHMVVVTPPLPQVPTTGTTFSCTKGCGHTRQDCSGYFGNLPRFGGFADLPPKKT